MGQEAAVRTLYGTTDWFRIRKGVWQGCLLSPCLFNQYTEHITRNVGLDELPAGIKIGRRNINNFRYADDTTLMAESREELESPLMRVKEESEKARLKLNSKKKKKKKTEIMASSPISAWQTEGEKVEAVTDFLFVSSKITADGDCRKAMTNLDGWVEKQRHFSANKAPYSQGYALPSGHIQL